MSMLGTAAVNCVPLTNVVVSATPFHSTTEPLTKLLPVTISVNAGPPAVAEVCESDVRMETGLLIVKVTVLDVPPPGVGLNTVTEAVPGLVMSPAGTVAVSCVALINVVVNATPFHRTIAPLTKLVPVTASVNAGPPRVRNIGDSDPTVGVGFAAVIVNVSAFDAPPPGVGLNTVTGAVPRV